MHAQKERIAEFNEGKISTVENGSSISKHYSRATRLDRHKILPWCGARLYVEVRTKYVAMVRAMKLTFFYSMLPSLVLIFLQSLFNPCVGLP